MAMLWVKRLHAYIRLVYARPGCPTRHFAPKDLGHPSTDFRAVLALGGEIIRPKSDSFLSSITKSVFAAMLHFVKLGPRRK